MEAAGAEFVRVKRSSKESDLAPNPYGSGDPDWSRQYKWNGGLVAFPEKIAPRWM